MLDAIAGAIFIFLVLLGTVAVCYVFMLKLLLPKTDGDYFLIMPFGSNSKNVRKTAYGMRLKLNLLGDEYRSKIVVLDCGIAENEKQELSEVCRESCGIYLVERDKIRDFLNGRI